MCVVLCIGLQHPWPLYGGTLTWTTLKTEATSATDADAEKQPAEHTDGTSEEMTPDAAGGTAESTDTAGSVADVLFGGRYYRAIIGEAKEADDGGDEDDEDDKGDSDDGDSCSDLYPG